MTLKQTVEQFKSRDDIAELLPKDGIGIELGVAEGFFAERLLRRSQLVYLYGVDWYSGDRAHDVEQYRRALTRLDPFRHRYTLLRMTFKEAISLFSAGYFDFIYVDGYGHNGSGGVETFRSWYSKLASGGIMAGDDYEPKYPLTVQAVNQFVQELDLELVLLRPSGPTPDWASKSTNWIVRKP